MGKGVKNAKVIPASEYDAMFADDTPQKETVIPASEYDAMFADDPTSQKKSPVASEPTSDASSQQPQNGVSQTQKINPWEGDAPLGTISAGPSAVTGISSGALLSDQVTNSKRYVPAPVTDTKQAVTHVANDYIRNNGAPAGIEINDPKNPVNAITDPHGNPEAVSHYVQSRMDQLKAKYPYEDVSNLPEAQDLLANAGHVLSLQLFNREFQQPKPSEQSVSNKILSLDKQHEKDVAEIDKQIEATTKWEHPHGTAAVDERDRLKYQKKLLDENLTVEKNKADRETKYDPVVLGAEYTSMLGDKQAEADLERLKEGKTIRQDRQHDYYIQGDRVIRQGASSTINENAKKEGNLALDRSAKQYYEKNKPAILDQAANEIANLRYKDENSLLHAIVPSYAIPDISKEEIEKYGKEKGFSDDVIKELVKDPSRIPKSSSFAEQAVASMLNTAAPIYEQGVRMAGRIGNGNEEAINEHFSPGWEQKRGFGALVSGNIPTEQNSFHNVRGALGQIIGGAAGLSIFAGEVGGVAKGIEAIGAGTKTAGKLANFGVMAFNGYNDAYHNSLEVIGDKPEDEGKRQLYSLVNGIAEGAIFSISPPGKLVTNALGMETKTGQQLMKEIKKNGSIEFLQTAKGKDAILQHVMEIAKENGTQVTLATGHKITENIINTIVAPERKGEDGDLTNTAVSTSLAMLLPSIFGAHGHIKTNSRLNDAAAFEIGSHPQVYIDHIAELQKEGKMTQEDVVKSHDAILTMKNIIDNAPTKNAEGQPLPPDHIKQYAANMMQEHIAQQQIDEITENATSAGLAPDKAQLAPLEKRIKELQKGREEIITTPVATPVAKTKAKADQGAEPSTERRNEASTEPKASAPKEKTEEKLANTEKENIPLIPQEGITPKTNEHGNENSNEEGRQSSPSESRIRQEGPSPEEAANSEGRRQQPENRELGTERSTTPKGEAEQPVVKQPESPLKKTREEKLKEAKQKLKDAKKATSPEAKSGEIPVVKKEAEEKGSGIHVAASDKGAVEIKLKPDAVKESQDMAAAQNAKAEAILRDQKNEENNNRLSFESAIEKRFGINSEEAENYFKKGTSEVQRRLGLSYEDAKIAEKDYQEIIAKHKEKSNQGTEPSTERRNEVPSESPASATKKETKNASAPSKEQEQKSPAKSSKPEHARVEQAGSKAKATEAKNSDSDQRGEKKKEVTPATTTEQNRKKGSFEKDGITYTRNEKQETPTGKEGSIEFSKGVDKPFTYQLVESDKLQPAAKDGKRNPNHFIPEAQPKERTDVASKESAEKIADKPDLGKVGDAPNAYSGAPVVNARGEVIQGNNRAEGLKKHHDKNGTSYKQQLAADAEKFGLTKEQVEAMDKPILVRRVEVGDEEAIKLGNYDAKDIETGGKNRVDPVATSRRMSPKDKLQIIKALNIEGEDKTLNQAVRDNFDRVIKLLKDHLRPAQIDALTSRSGEPTSEGLQDVEKLITHFLFDGGDVNLPDHFEGLSDAARKGLIKAFPKIFSTSAENSLLPEVQNALIAHEDFQTSKNPSFASWKAQGDMFAEGRSPEDTYTPLELKIAEALSTAKTQREINELFAKYAEAVNGKPGDMFGGEVVGLSKSDAIKKVFKTTYDEKQSKFEREKAESERIQEEADKPQVPTEEAAGEKLKSDTKEFQDAIDHTRKGGIGESDLNSAIRKSNELYDKAKALENNSDLESQAKRYDLRDEAQRVRDEAVAQVSPFEKVADTEDEVMQLKSKKYNETKCRSLSKEHQEKYGGEYKEVEVTNPDGSKVTHAVVVHDDYVYEPQTNALIKKSVFDEYFDTDLSGKEKPNQSPERGTERRNDAQPEPPAPTPKEISEQIKDLTAKLKEDHKVLTAIAAKGKIAEETGDKAEAKRLQEQWEKKEAAINKREEEKAELEKQQAQNEKDELSAKWQAGAEKIKTATKKIADALTAKGLKPGDKSAAIFGVSAKSIEWFGDHVAKLYAKLGNVEYAIRKAYRDLREKFKDEEEPTEKGIRQAIAHYGADLEPQRKEPILSDEIKEAGDIYLEDIRGGSTPEEAKSQIESDEDYDDKDRADLFNYIDWHMKKDEKGIRNAITRLKREQFGLNKEIPADIKTYDEVWQQAKDKIEENPEIAQQLVDELSKHPRPVDALEDAILLHHNVTLENRNSDLNSKINDAADGLRQAEKDGDQAAILKHRADMVEHQLAKAAVADKMQQAYDVFKAVGTENARGLAFRRMMSDMKFTLVNMVAEKRAANDGQPLSEKQQQEIEDLHQKIVDTQKELDDYKKQKEAQMEEHTSQIIELQEKALSGKIKNKKSAAEKIRNWAKRMGGIKSAAYSSPRPERDPKMISEALVDIATGVEGGGELTDVVKKTVKKTKESNPDINEQHLEREINKELINSGILEPSKETRKARNEIMSGFFKDGKLDQKLIDLNVAANRARNQFDTDIKKDEQTKRSRASKGQDWFVKLEREFKLSNPLTLGKLTAAAATRLATEVAEEGIGTVYTKLFPRLAKGAIGEGNAAGFRGRAIASDMTRGLMLGIKDAKKIWEKGSEGKSDLDVLFGKGGDLPPEAMTFFGEIHSMLKAPAKRAVFEKQLYKRLDNYIANGVDVSDPMVQTQAMNDAYIDANRGIFMQDNKVANWYQRQIKEWERGTLNKATGKIEAPGKWKASTLKYLIPFVKVPSNIIAETAKFAYGLPVGLAQVAHAYALKEVDNLTPDQRDIIMRNLKKGTMGAAAMALGFFAMENFGGYYQSAEDEKKKKRKGEPRAMGINTPFGKLPQWAGEAPVFQAMQLGATVNRVWHERLHGEEKGLPSGVIAAALGLAEEQPLIGNATRIGGLIKSHGSQGEWDEYVGELAKGTLVPAILDYSAKATDPADEGSLLHHIFDPENHRKRKTIPEHIESGIPGLRENLPEK